MHTRLQPKSQSSSHEEIIAISFVASCIVGCNIDERFTKQKLVFDLELRSKEKAISEKEVRELLALTLALILKKRKPKLLESLALEVLELMQPKLFFAEYVVITIKKPAALKNARCAYVRLAFKP
jgi:dihydroneopterin aldolase